MIAIRNPRPRLNQSTNFRPSIRRLIQISFLVFFSFNLRSQSLVGHGDLWRYRKGRTPLAAGWKTADDGSLDGSWLSGRGGFGYADNSAETALCQTLLSDMDGGYSTLAMRKTILITSDPDPALHLTLTMDFDDGFIAWLDGVFLASVNSPGSPNEPAYNSVATGNHESSRGDSSSVPPTTYDLGAVGSRLGAGSHILAIIGLNSSLGSSSDFIQIADLTLSSGPPAGCESGTITKNTTWPLSKSPILVCGNLTVASGVTLMIEPGVVVQFDSGIGLTISNGGRMLAEGNETNRIRFTGVTDQTRWGGIVVDGASGSPETRIAYADFAANGTTAIHAAGGTVFLDNLNFSATDHAYVSLDDSSFIVSHCQFPAPTSRFEPAHGTGGIKSGGHGIFRRNYFGGTVGYDDVVDFTGGQRGGPIVHFINNVVAQGQDDGFDLDGTDAWVEGNIFLHVHRNGGTPDSSAAISGGNNGGETSEVTIVGNLFFDCDNATTAKQGNFFALVNNTIIHTTKTGGIDGASGVINVRDTTPSLTTFGRGQYLEGNIIWDGEELVRNYDATQTTVTFNNNLIFTAWNGPGSENIISNPLLSHIPSLTEANFSTWHAAQVLREWFTPQAGSPAIGTGPNGRDKGGVVPIGISFSGFPSGTTQETSATLTLGFHRTGFGIPTSGWPNGVGYTHYKWRLDGGNWSAETPTATPIVLTDLNVGPHFVEAVGKRDSGLYQDDPIFGEDATITRTPTWIVAAAGTPLRFTSITRTTGTVHLTFEATAGKSYSLLERDALDEVHPWTKLQSLTTQSASGGVTLIDDATTGADRFYMLVTPAIP